LHLALQPCTLKHKDFIELVRFRRRGVQLTQMDVADALEISQSHYAQFESGKKMLSMTHILKLIETLNLEILPKSSGMNSSWVSSFLSDTNASIEEVLNNLEALNLKLQENVEGDLEELMKEENRENSKKAGESKEAS